MKARTSSSARLIGFLSKDHRSSPLARRSN
jgi:hypothetical protein